MAVGRYPFRLLSVGHIQVTKGFRDDHGRQGWSGNDDFGFVHGYGCYCCEARSDE